jgi:hypothetical protein
MLSASPPLVTLMLEVEIRLKRNWGHRLTSLTQSHGATRTYKIGLKSAPVKSNSLTSTDSKTEANSKGKCSSRFGHVSNATINAVTRMIPASKGLPSSAYCWHHRHLRADCLDNVGSSVWNNPKGCVRFQVFTAVTMKNGVFWDVTPCGSCKNRRFGGT